MKRFLSVSASVAFIEPESDTGIKSDSVVQEHFHWFCLLSSSEVFSIKHWTNKTAVNVTWKDHTCVNTFNNIRHKNVCPTSTGTRIITNVCVCVSNTCCRTSAELLRVWLMKPCCYQFCRVTNQSIGHKRLWLDGAEIFQSGPSVSLSELMLLASPWIMLVEIKPKTFPPKRTKTVDLETHRWTWEASAGSNGVFTWPKIARWTKRHRSLTSLYSLEWTPCFCSSTDQQSGESPAKKPSTFPPLFPPLSPPLQLVEIQWMSSLFLTLLQLMECEPSSELLRNKVRSSEPLASTPLMTLVMRSSKEGSNDLISAGL